MICVEYILESILDIISDYKVKKIETNIDVYLYLKSFIDLQGRYLLSFPTENIYLYGIELILNNEIDLNIMKFYHDEGIKTESIIFRW